MGFKGGHFVLR